MQHPPSASERRQSLDAPALPLLAFPRPRPRFFLPFPPPNSFCPIFLSRPLLRFFFRFGFAPDTFIAISRSPPPHGTSSRPGSAELVSVLRVAHVLLRHQANRGEVIGVEAALDRLRECLGDELVDVLLERVSGAAHLLVEERL